MARLFLLIAAAFAVGSVLVGSAGATPSGDSRGMLGVLDIQSAALIGADDDLFAGNASPDANSGAMQFGPYPSVTTDSGTCGADWAQDTMTREFKIQQVGFMMYRVTEKFRDGTFVTIGPTPQPSPGACDSSDGTGPGTIDPGVTGTFQGYDMIAITSATYTPESASCAYPCDTTTQFLVSVFGAGAASRDDYAFFFHYVSNDHSLVYHEWKNASCNRGGNHGDIQSMGVAGVATPSCP
ncbi:MAG TPA: hypothetical protein VK488_05710 [Gaiellaceae bacterium]|nr:hypothetical protein [Gaiellaceae bacterium]